MSDIDFKRVYNVDNPAELIKAWRTRAGLTQAQMAEVLAIPKRTIENWEEGKRVPSGTVLMSVINVLEVYVLSKCSFSLDRTRNDFLKRIINDSFSKYYFLLQSLLLNSKDELDFINRVLSTDALKDSQIYAELSKKSPGHWKRIREIIGDKCVKTESDAGGLKIGNSSFSVIIPNGYGDGTTRFAIMDEGTFNTDMLNYFTEVTGPFDVYDYDCGNSVCLSAESGKYSIYYYSGIIIFERHS